MRLRSLVVTVMFAVAVAGAPLLAQGAAQAKPAGAQDKPAATLSKTLAAVQGTWMFTQMDGQDVAASGQEIAVTITDDKYVQTINGQVVERGTFKLDDTKKPWTIDLNILEGNDAGKTQVGIVQLTGNTMVGKLADSGIPTRPTDFTQSEGAFVFTAVKKP
jgi:uncharacterized protein (TIGR03067 family)